jgi:transcriptional regulator with XRE-family HTH domain
MTVGQVIRQMREERGWSQAKLGVLSGTGPSGISQIETGRRNPSAATLERIAKALKVEVRELFPLAQAPLLDFEEEPRTAWEAAVVNASALREGAQGRMGELISAWSESKERGEDPNERRNYLDAMRVLLQQAYDAETALVKASSGARLADQWPEIQTADRFYVELWRRVQDAGLSIRTNSEQAAEQEAATESAQPEPRPYSVEEPKAA